MWKALERLGKWCQEVPPELQGKPREGEHIPKKRATSEEPSLFQLFYLFMQALKLIAGGLLIGIPALVVVMAIFRALFGPSH